MMRWCLILIIFPLPGGAQKFSARDLWQLKLYSTGIFSNKCTGEEGYTFCTYRVAAVNDNYAFIKQESH